MKQGRAHTGHPVDVASGVQFTASHDVVIPGYIPLIWRRFYSTGLLDDNASIQGRGWVHFFDMWLARDLEGYRLFGFDGAEIEFGDPSNIVDGGGAILNLGEFMELKREGEQYSVYHWHGFQEDVRKLVFQARDDGPMLLDRVDLPAGPCLQLRYDRKRLIEVRQSVEGRRLLLEYNERGLLSRLFTASRFSDAELAASYEYDERAQLTGVYDASASAVRYAYDDAGRLIEEVGRGGSVYRMKYDDWGRCVETEGEDGHGRRRLEYDDAKRTTKVTDSLGHVTRYEFNENGQVEMEERPDGSMRSTQFDNFGRITGETGPMSEAKQYTYDGHGDTSEIVYSSGTSTKIEYDDQHQPVLITSAGGGSWQLRYGRGAVTAIVDPLGAETVYVRDSENVVTEIQTPLGNIISVHHNTDWSEVTYSDHFGLLGTRRYDRHLNVSEIRNSHGIQQRYEYDLWGRVTAIIEADGATRRVVRDPSGNVLRYTDANGHITRIEYTKYSEITRIADPNGFIYKFAWDTEGRLVQSVNPKGEIATYAYDGVGNVTERRSFDGRVERFEYNNSRRSIKHHKADNKAIEYLYNESEQLLRVLDQNVPIINNTFDASGQLTETTTPDAVVKFEYDVGGRCIAEIQNGRRIEFAYDTYGHVIRQTFDGSRVGPLVFEHDERGRLASIGSENGVLEQFEYDDADLLVKRVVGESVEQLGYDRRCRLQSQKVIRARRDDVLSRNFEYDSEYNLTQMSDSLRGVTSYEYDPSDQLIRTRSPERPERAYEYDLCGNLVRKASESLTYESGNRLVSRGSTVYERDQGANLTVSTSSGAKTTFFWNSLDQLVKVVGPDSSTTKFGYDGLGRRVFKEQGDKRTDYYWAGDDLVCELTDGSSIEYVMTGSTPIIIWENGDIRHVITAVLAAPLELLDASGTLVWQGTYDEWGLLLNDVANGASNRLRLPGQYFDSETALHYNRFRYYSPLDGRFISPDPVGLLAGLNEFIYAVNPVNWVDPLGLTCGNTGCGTYSVYVLRDGHGQVVYVGITGQLETTRLTQHRYNGRTFHQMDIIAENLSGGGGITGYRQARDIEGSLLHHIGSPGSLPGVSPSGLQNAPRLPPTGGYYHAYHSTPGGNRTLLSSGTSANYLNPPPIRTHL